MHGASSYLSIRLIFAILLLVGGMVVTGLLWLMKQVRRHEASKLGFVYCPLCDSSVTRREGGAYRCMQCDHRFEDTGHIPDVQGF